VSQAAIGGIAAFGVNKETFVQKRERMNDSSGSGFRVYISGFGVQV
jgi:hypothetical protein